MKCNGYDSIYHKYSNLPKLNSDIKIYMYIAVLEYLLFDK